MPPTAQKMTPDQFAQSIKAKYPQYDSIDNATLTQKILAKYPQYADRVQTQSPSFLSQAVGAIGSVGMGALKGIGSTLTNIGKTVTDPYSKLIGAPQPGLTGQQLKPQGLGEKIGYGGEKIGEFFAPGGVEAKTVEKAIPLIERIPEALGLSGLAAKTLANTLKVATQGAVTGASTAGVSTLQGGTTEQVKSSGEAGLFAGSFGKALEIFGKPVVQAVMKSGFKLTPAAEAKAANKANSAAKFMTDNGIYGDSKTKYTKLSDITDKFETALQKTVSNTFSASKSKIAQYINQNVEKLKTSDPAVYPKARREANTAIQLLQSLTRGTQKDSIGLGDVLSSKRSYGSAAFRESQASVKDPRVTSDGQFAIEQAFYQALDDSLKTMDRKVTVPQGMESFFGGKKQVPLKEFNDVYSKAITARNFSRLAQFKGDTGLVGRMLSLWVGESIGQAVAPGLGGKIMGALGGEALLQNAPGVVRNVTERAIGQGGAVIPGATKVGLGIGATQ